MSSNDDFLVYAIVIPFIALLLLSIGSIGLSSFWYLKTAEWQHPNVYESLGYFLQDPSFGWLGVKSIMIGSSLWLGSLVSAFSYFFIALFCLAQSNEQR